MFWDGTRWVDETTVNTATTERRGRRRHRGAIATAIVSVAMVALLIPFSGVAAATPITRLIDQWNNAAVVKTYSEQSSLVTYKGSWPRRYHTDYRGNYARSAAVRGASATFRFKGSAVAWAGAVGPDRGRANVYIDGVFKKTVDLHATSFRAQNILYQVTFSRSASHTLKVVVLGTARHPRITVDGFVVRGPLGSTPTVVPSGSRPFAAPATTRSVTVPSSIDASGGSDVRPALQSFINSQPNGTAISFPSGAVYRVGAGIRLDNRHNLILDGRGTTIRTTGSGGSALSSPFVLSWATGNTDIWIRNFVLEGNNTRTGTAIYDGAQESQAGIHLSGGARIEFSGLTIRRMNGDGLYANENTPSAGSAAAWPTDIWFHDNSIDYVGRNAFTINSGRRVTLERNGIDHVGGSVLDIEPDLRTQGAADLILRNNIVGIWGMSPAYSMHFVACANNTYGVGAVVRGITITGNRVTGGAPNSANTPNAGGLLTSIRKSRTSDVTFTNNSTTKAGNGPVLRFEHVDGLTVRGNTQPLTSGSLTSISDSTGVTLN